MSYNSPNNYSHKGNPHFRYSDGFKPSYISPPNKRQSFSPYNYSSPKQHNRGGRGKYFNTSTPYNHWNHRDAYHKNNRSYEHPTPTWAYYSPSMLENPWAELEKEWEEKKEQELNSKTDEDKDKETSSK